MANLDLTYYRGEDQYSDGDEIENRLLAIAESGKTLDDLPAEEIPWPVLYHLHPVRENICNWYPFRAGSRILEIGSGCGAVTGALCRSGCEVYSVELSKRRAGINYARNKDCERLHIMVGNLNDMEFGEPFDYVVLIGVLEYAGKYTGGARPYRTFLENIRKYVKPDGRLLIAIENRLGLKYFSGANEDHLGKPFAGLRGYDPAQGVRTFSREELRELLQQSGYPTVQFFYPWPDYKFPLEIFSEEGLRTMRYGKAYYPVDEPRFALFPEAEIARTLAGEGVAGVFANSFFAEAGFTGDPDAEAGKILYVKLNNDRGESFRTGTMIRKAGTGREVLKYPLAETAAGHIAEIRENERRLADAFAGAADAAGHSRGNVLSGRETPEGTVYPFVDGPTADTRLEELLQAGDPDGALSLLDDVYRLIAVSPEEQAYDSEAFTRWFGGRRTEAGTALCVRPANVDMILDNVFLRDGGYTVLDCEWVADFPVPAAFVMWRTLSAALHAYPELERALPRDAWEARYGIRPEDEPVYAAWSEHFEAVYTGNRSLARFSRGIRNVELDQRRMDWQEARIAQLEARERDLQQQIRDIRHLRVLKLLKQRRAAKK